MSVINQVLKNLDEREPLANSAQKYHLPVDRQADENTDYLRIAIWVLLLLGLIVAGGYYYWLNKQADSIAEFKPVEAIIPARIVVIEEPGNTDSDDQSLSQQANRQVETKTQRVTLSVVDNPEVDLTEIQSAEKAVVMQQKKTIVAVEANITKPEPVVSYLPLRNDSEISQTNDVPKSKLLEPKTQNKEIVITKSAKEGIPLVRDLLDTGRFTEAEKTLRKILVNNSNSVAAHELMTGLLLRNDRLDEAMKQLTVARKLYPYNDNLVMLESKVLLQQGKVEAVTTLLENMQVKGKAGQQSTAMLASLYQQKKDYQGSLRLYNRLAKAFPANAGYWMGLAISLDALNDRDKAQAAYKNALQAGGLTVSLNNYARQRITSINQQNSRNQ
jgi:tetratricopeptide (TPR) repeat protein